MQERRTRPATAEDFHRLAAVAQDRGLRVFEHGPNQWFCTSHSDPFALHVVTGFSCDCRGFLEHQRCSHHALLLERLGWLPEVEDASAAFSAPSQENGRIDAESSLVSAANAAFAEADCPDCSGCGVQHFRTFEDRCPSCGGTGIRPNHHPHDVPAGPMVAAAA